MGRLVQPAVRGRAFVSGGNLEAAGEREVTVGGDNYQDRIAKYIPGEVIAGYMTLDRTLVPSKEAFAEAANKLKDKIPKPGQLSEAVASAGTDPNIQLAIHNAKPLLLLAIGLVFTPLYIWNLARTAEAGAPWRMQAVISTLAFLVWAYAIQGSAFVVGPGANSYAVYDGGNASALVILFTLLSGVFGPKPMAQMSKSSGSTTAGSKL